MSNTPYPYIITAIERDGLDLRVLTMNFDILQENLDLRSAIRMAVAEYLQTDEGKQTYRDNCEQFNWADFYTCVPNAICKKYGFLKKPEAISDEVVDWNESLADTDS